MSEPIALAQATIDALAAALADALEERRSERSRWVNAQTVAEHLAVDVGYVYEHAAELGGYRLGTGPKARLRFKLDRVNEALCHPGRGPDQRETRTAIPNRARRRQPGLGTTVPLLPIRGENGCSPGAF